MKLFKNGLIILFITSLKIEGKENTIDFKPFIFSSSHPDIKKYQDKKLFQNFHLEYGEIEWNDYELAFPIYDLYEGQI